MIRRSEKTAKILTWAMLIHCSAFILFWWTNTPLYQAVDHFIAERTGKYITYMLLPMLFFAGLGVWCLVRIIFARRRGKALRGSILFYVLCAVFLLLFYAIFAVIFFRYPIQWPRLVQLFNFFRPIIEVPVLVLLVVLTLPMAARAFRLRKEQPPYAVALVSIWIFVWSFSLWSPPDSVYRGALPAKPMLIAHRGASSLAPENTLAAVNMAALIARQGVMVGAGGLTFSNPPGNSTGMGVETDIRVSLDGTLFLMHDATLTRTTNVAAVFPQRRNDNASLFTMTELQQLSAGQWFIESHPNGSVPIGLVSREQLKSYAAARVPTLQDWLQVVKENHLIFIFDLLPPPEGHPYYDQFFTLCFGQIRRAGIDDQIWFLVEESEYWKVRAASGEMHLVHNTHYRHPPEVITLQSLGYEIVNSEYGLPGHWLREYQAARIKVNLWTVDEPWQFSRLWVMGVDSVTTNNLQVFASENTPVLAIPYGAYVIAWCLLGAGLTLFVILRRKKY